MVFVCKQTFTQHFPNQITQPIQFELQNNKIGDQNETFLVIFKYCATHDISASLSSSSKPIIIFSSLFLIQNMIRFRLEKFISVTVGGGWIIYAVQKWLIVHTSYLSILFCTPILFLKKRDSVGFVYLWLEKQARSERVRSYCKTRIAKRHSILKLDLLLYVWITCMYLFHFQIYIS